MPIVRAALRCSLSIALAAASVQAQAPDPARGSRYLSMESWAYDAVAGLRRRGLLPGLDPLAQPYRRADIAALVAGLDPDALAGPARHWARLLRAELGPELARAAGRDSLTLGFDALARVVGSTSRRLDPLLPLREPDVPASLDRRAWPSYGLGGWAERGRFALETRLFHDLHQEANGRGDPDGRDPGGIVVLNRVDNAYLSAAYSLGTLFVGRMRRNWGPLGSGGLMVSPAPTTYPQLGLDIGGRNLVLRFMVGELDTLPGELRGSGRFVVAHHLEYRRADFAVSIGEGKVYTTRGGPLLNNLNPLELMFFDQDAEPNEPTSNTVLDGQLWLRRGRLTLSGEALLDDVHVTDHAPIRGALSMSARYAGPRPWLELGADYRLVSSLAYWSTRYVDQWTHYGRGLGDNYSDYDRLTLQASVFPRVAGLRLTPALQLQRKGEGDIRMPPFATDSQFRATPSFIIGRRETTVRAALLGRWQPVRAAFLEWDVGVSRVRGADHEPGRVLTELSGLARLGVTWSAPRGRFR